MIQIGISTACFYPMYTEQVLEKVIGLGFRTFEIFFNSPSELKAPFLRGLKAQLDAVGGRVVSLHPFTSGYESFLLFSQYLRRFEDGLEMYKEYYQAARILGADILVIHGEKNMPHFSDDEYICRFNKLAEQGREAGVRIAQENVVGYRAQKPEFIREMRHQLGKNAYFVLDIKQCIRARVAPLVMCEAMGENLIHLHANDHNLNRDCLLPGEGTMDYVQLFLQMKSHGFSGSCVMEVYNNAIRNDEELIRAGQHLEDCARRANL